MTRRSVVNAVIAALVMATVPGSAAASLHASPHSGVRATAIVPNGSWTTYHRDDGHTGYDASAPAITSVHATPGWSLTALDDSVYAEPLIFNGVVYAATLNGTVYGLNQIDGSLVWSKNLGTAETSGWGCGNISNTGILGTPVIDPAGNVLYVVSEVDIRAKPTDPPIAVYRLFALDLASAGNVMWSTTLTVAGFDWKIEQERGALAFRNGVVYIPFGGRAGDCGAYHGYVFAVSTSTHAITGTYQTPGIGAGFWAAGGVTIDDATGDVFVTSGNGTGSGCNANGDGTPTYLNDAVTRLAPTTLAYQQSFVPLDWQNDWCGNDEDLGSSSPVIISSSLIYQSGKWGTGFLVNPASLGGMNGQLFPAQNPYNEVDTCFGNQSDATFASPAYAAPFVYQECDGHGLVALSVNTSAPSFAACNATCASPNWHVGGTTTFGPPIIAGGAVWVASTDGTGLFAYNQTTGAQIFHSAGFAVNRFSTPAEAGAQVFVASDTVIRSFSFAGAVTLTPSQVDFGGVAPTTKSTIQTVTLQNNSASTVNVSAVSLTGANGSDFTKGTDTCTGATVTIGSTCTVQVSFTPPALGGFPASLTFTDTGANSPQSVTLNGAGAIDNAGHLYTLDGYGGLHADGTAPAMAQSAYWPGWNIARSVALFPDGTGGYTLDGYGGLHPFGSAGNVSGEAYWRGWDIARQVVLAPWSTPATPAGWTLDGYGGVHAFGGAPSISASTYWRGWDIARGLAVLPDSTPGAVAGYTLDGYGGIHPFGGAPPITNAPYFGWDIARSIALSPNASKANGAAGWVLDGWGGVHAFGNAPNLQASAYWRGWDIARGVVAATGSGPAVGGWVLDGWGGIHPFGATSSVSAPYWPGRDIATSLAGNTSNSGSRRRT